MSKPLALVLQLVGLVMILMGAATEPLDWAFIAWGVVIALAGGIGLRERIQADRKS